MLATRGLELDVNVILRYFNLSNDTDLGHITPIERSGIVSYAYEDNIQSWGQILK